MSFDSFIVMRRWTFAEGSGLYPRITVRANMFDKAYERAKRGLDARYMRAHREAPVAWSLTLVGVRLDHPGFK